MTARFITHDELAEHFRGKSVAIVGSAPSVLDNKTGFIVSHDVVVRINNYKTGSAQGHRTDVHYSFYGNSIRKEAELLQIDGVKLCVCKCPDGKPIECDWHERNGKQIGIDFRYIYALRKNWWFCDTYIPTAERFVQTFNLLGRHIPTTGFAAILDVLACQPKSVYLTGFDFFTSFKHNVDEPWRAGDPNDPIRHMPEFEARWLTVNAEKYPMTFDRKLSMMLDKQWSEGT